MFCETIAPVWGGFHLVLQVVSWRFLFTTHHAELTRLDPNEFLLSPFNLLYLDLRRKYFLSGQGLVLNNKMYVSHIEIHYDLRLLLHSSLQTSFTLLILSILSSLLSISSWCLVRPSWMSVSVDSVMVAEVTVVEKGQFTQTKPFKRYDL